MLELSSFQAHSTCFLPLQLYPPGAPRGCPLVYERRGKRAEPVEHTLSLTILGLKIRGVVFSDGQAYRLAQRERYTFFYYFSMEGPEVRATSFLTNFTTYLEG